MRIGYRLTLFLAGPLVVLMALFGYLDDHRTRARNREELAREGRSVARTLQLAIEDYFRDRQLEDVRDIGDQVTRYERILGLRVFNADGAMIYESTSLSPYPFISQSELLAVLREGRSFEIQRKLGNESATSFLLPLTGSGGRRLGALQLLQLASFIEEEARASRTSMIMLTLSLILAVTSVIYLVTLFGVSRPTEDLVRHFRSVGAGDLDARVPIRGRDEFGRLAQEFNAMCGRLEIAQRTLSAEQERRQRAETALRTAERLASVGRLAAGLAHEIGTPLNVISGRTETLLRRDAGDPKEQRSLRIIMEQIDRISRIVQGMLDFARGRQARPRPADLSEVLKGVLEFMDNRFERRKIHVEYRVPTPLPPVMIDPDQISQVLLNLTVNAVEAMPQGGNLSIRAETTTRPNSDPSGHPGPFLALVFQDTGVGIAPEHLGRVFDPFFTTKDVGSGAGLGLSVSYGIMQEHGGWIEMQSGVGEGTRVTVFLPLADTGASKDGGSV
jgi:signal transduction histidine kinase